jgi:hypothetical protein
MSIAPKDQYAFLYQVCFGSKGDELDRFIFRGYRDMCRTLRGLAKFDEEHDSDSFDKIRGEVKESIITLSRTTYPEDIDAQKLEFDKWHKKACERIIEKFGPFNPHYGQAQKWLNMTVKYCWAFGEQLPENLSRWFVVAHMPIDHVIIEYIKGLKESKIAIAKEEWSKWDADTYQKLQDSLNKVASDGKTTRLALEFSWWLDETKKDAQGNK